MARTPLAKTLKRLMNLTALAKEKNLSPDQILEMQARARLTRREAIRRTLEMAAVAPFAGMALREAMAAEITKKIGSARGVSRHIASVDGKVIIIGGGTAGLTAAYRLSLAGVPFQIYEANDDRMGGRMFTKRNFNSDGMFCELGGELVDTGHEELQGLCGELGLEIQPLDENEADNLNMELYFVHGKVYHQKELMEAFGPLVAQLIEDKKTIYGNEDAATPTYQNPFNSLPFDNRNMDLHKYLYSKKNVERWVLDLIDVTYTGEYGLPTNKQSAMNLIGQIGTDPGDEVKLLGVSDENKRIMGGNGTLPETLAKLIPQESIFKSHVLVAIKDNGDQFTLTFDNKGTTVTVRSSQIISAIPFTILRDVKGIGSLGLSPRKLMAIQKLGYGTNAKLMTGYKTRVWRNLGENLKSNGLAYTDTTSQEFWETSRKQKGDRGIITSFRGGDVGLNSKLERLDRLVAENVENLNKLFPGAKAQFDGNKALMHWPSYKFTKGSYTCPLPGQYNEIIGSCGEPELGSRFCFAGEHTSVDFSGFMNGAVSSGNRVANDILASRNIPIPEPKKKSG